MFLCYSFKSKSKPSKIWRKNHTKKRSNLKNSKKSGTSREAVEKAASELQQWSFLTWFDDFVQSRASRSSLYVDYSQQFQQSQPPIEENNNFLDDEEPSKHSTLIQLWYMLKWNIVNVDSSIKVNVKTTLILSWL